MMAWLSAGMPREIDAVCARGELVAKGICSHEAMNGYRREPVGEPPTILDAGS